MVAHRDTNPADTATSCRNRRDCGRRLAPVRGDATMTNSRDAAAGSMPSRSITLGATLRSPRRPIDQRLQPAMSSSSSKSMTMLASGHSRAKTARYRGGHLGAALLLRPSRHAHGLGQHPPASGPAHNELRSRPSVGRTALRGSARPPSSSDVGRRAPFLARPAITYGLATDLLPGATPQAMPLPPRSTSGRSNAGQRRRGAGAVRRIFDVARASGQQREHVGPPVERNPAVRGPQLSHAPPTATDPRRVWPVRLEVRRATPRVEGQGDPTSWRPAPGSPPRRHHRAATRPRGTAAAGPPPHRSNLAPERAQIGAIELPGTSTTGTAARSGASVAVASTHPRPRPPGALESPGHPHGHRVEY